MFIKSKCKSFFFVGDVEYVVHTEKTRPQTYVMSFEDNSYSVSGNLEGNKLTTTFNGHRQTAVVIEHEVEQASAISLFTDDAKLTFKPLVADLGEEIFHDDGSGFKAPMNGTVVDVLVKTGDTVTAGDTLVIMEAMKMEHAIKAPGNGLVSEIFYTKGDMVDGGADLLAFEPA